MRMSCISSLDDLAFTADNTIPVPRDGVFRKTAPGTDSVAPDDYAFPFSEVPMAESVTPRRDDPLEMTIRCVTDDSQ